MTKNQTDCRLKQSQKLSAPLWVALSLFLVFTQRANAIHFPTVLELQQESYNPHIEWNGNKPISHRYEQKNQFDADSFANLVALYANGAAWHEWDGGADRAKTLKQFPGLEQQWILKGYGDEKGWLGSGLFQGRYYLVFQESPPGGMVTVTDVLRLNPITEIFTYLDTSSEWLHTPCEKVAQGSKANSKKSSIAEDVCFVAANESHWSVRIGKGPNSSLDIWNQEPESSSLKEIRSALESIPDMGQNEYAQDLSQMLLGEAQHFLVKISERVPVVFNWPSWQLQTVKEGRVPAKEFFGIVNRSQTLGDSLPTWKFMDKNKMQLSVDLFFSGKLHLRAEKR